MLIDWLLFIVLLGSGLSLVLAEHQAAWLQWTLGVPTVLAALAILTRKMRPKLFNDEDSRPRLAQHAIALCVVLVLVGVIGGGAIYLDTYHNPGREVTRV